MLPSTKKKKLVRPSAQVEKWENAFKRAYPPLPTRRQLMAVYPALLTIRQQKCKMVGGIRCPFNCLFQKGINVERGGGTKRADYICFWLKGNQGES